MKTTPESSELLLTSLSRAITDISGLPDCRGPLRRSYYDLARRIKLLSPLIDELGDGVIGEESMEVGALSSLLDALVSAKELLRLVNDGSKLYQALQKEIYANRFQEVTEHIEKAPSGISYDEIVISEEVKEQIELVHSQFRRAKESVESPDFNMTDLALAQARRYSDPIVLKRLSDNLQLTTINDLKKNLLLYMNW